MMFKPLKSIGLWFENCEYYVLPAEYIQAYEFLNVHTDLFTNHEYQTCDGFAMTIHRAANQTNWKDAGTGQYVADLFARLEDRDLCSVTVTYKSGDEREIVLPWNSADDETNDSMHTIRTQLCHHLAILVGDDDFVKEHLATAEQNDEWEAMSD